MKDPRNRTAVPAFLLLGLVLAGCPAFPPGRGITGKLALDIQASLAKTILPTLSVASYRISFSGPADHDPVSTMQADPLVELEAGTWSISVEGLDAGGATVAVGGQTGVEVIADSTTSVSIVLSAQASGSGTIDVAVSWPLSQGIDDVDVTLGPDESHMEAVPEVAVSFTPGAAMMRYVEAKAAGSYMLCIVLKSDGVQRANVQETVQVYGNLTSSETFVLTTDDFTSVPEAPSNLAVAEGFGKLDLSWIDNSGVETGYVVERGDAENGPFAEVTVDPLPANTVGYSDASVTLGTTYWYRVKAVNQVGDSEYAGPVSGKVEDPVPGDGGVLTCSEATASSIRVSWQKATDNASAQAALQYKVARSLSDNIKTVADVEANGTPAMDWTTDVATVKAIGLSAGTTYWFNVLVRDVAGNTSAYLCGSQSTTDDAVRVIGHANFDPASVSDADIAVAATLDVYFEHASVGINICGGIDALGVSIPRYLSGRASWNAANDPGWYDANDGLGDNDRGNPGGFDGGTDKIEGFTSSMNATLAGKLSVAMYKLCFIDTPEKLGGTALFDSARAAMENLQALYPSVAFVWWTMPIETTSALERQVYNDAVRAYCSANDRWLLDLADLESHDDSGTACVDGNGREILYSGYTSDGGHLNSTGSLKMAKAYWKLLSEIGRSR